MHSLLSMFETSFIHNSAVHNSLAEMGRLQRSQKELEILDKMTSGKEFEVLVNRNMMTHLK
jgi:hypothetical protein